MKKLFLLPFVLLALVSCTEYESYPLRPVSFEIGDKFYYSAKDTENIRYVIGDEPNPVIMNIIQRGDTLDIEYYRATDFLNYDAVDLGLNIKNVTGRFEDGARLEFTAPEGLKDYQLYKAVPYVCLKPVRTTSALDEDIYVATEGWIEFDRINAIRNTVSGRFEFKALLNDDQECAHPAEIEVRNGTFENIPFVVLTSE